MNAFICGTARNCEKHIAAVFRNIDQIATLFNKVHILVAYDQSNDKTLLELTKQKKTHPENMDILLGAPEQLTRIRTQNISRARNALLDKMREFDSNEFPFFIMLDLDDICASPIRLDPLRRVLSEPSKWDCCSFNRAGYYDVWALSYHPYIYSCWGWYNSETVVEVMRDDIIYKLRETPDHEYLRVLSAFNNLAIYKTSMFLKCAYDWRMPKKYMTMKELSANQQILGFRHSWSPLDKQTDEPDCEHRHFHMQATYEQGARVMISPEHIFDDCYPAVAFAKK
jgi:hypothetical protein